MIVRLREDATISITTVPKQAAVAYCEKFLQQMSRVTREEREVSASGQVGKWVQDIHSTENGWY